MSLAIIEQMHRLAAAENAAARATWDTQEFSTPSRRDLVKPFIGSGLTQAEVARRTGITQGGVSHILKQTGWKL